MGEGKRAVVIGAGIGGLVCALLLAARGVHVIVVEKEKGPGGKVRQLGVNDSMIDAGPTVFAMRGIMISGLIFLPILNAVAMPLAPLPGQKPKQVFAASPKRQSGSMTFLNNRFCGTRKFIRRALCGASGFGV